MIRLCLLLFLSAGTALPALAQNTDPAALLGRSVVKISTRNASISIAGEGSGFFVDPTHVVTNWHVMQDVVEAKVIFVDGTFHDVTEVVAGDQTWDLMLLKVDVPGDKARPLSLASEPMVGEQTVFLATQGLLDEEYEREEHEPRSFHLREGLGELELFEDFELLRTKLVMIPGNSGSPVLDGSLEHVVGVAAMFHENTDGTVLSTFSIPARRVSALLEAGGDGVPLIRWQRDRMGSPQYYVDLMQVLMESGRVPMAVEIFEAYRTRQDNESAISREAWCLGGWANLVMAYDLEGEAWSDAMLKAQELYLKAINTTPRTSFDCIMLSNCTYSLGYIAWSFDEYRTCKQWLRRTLELDPRDADAIQVMSIVLAEQARWDRSDQWRQRLLDLVGDESALVTELDDWRDECRAAQETGEESDG